MTTGKTIALTRWTFVGKVWSLLFNMLSRLVIAFLPRRKCLFILWLQSPSALIWEPKKIMSVTVSIVSPSICHEVMVLEPRDFFGRNDAKAETPVLWPPHAKSSLIGKDSDAGRDWGPEQKGTTEDEMAG